MRLGEKFRFFTIIHYLTVIKCVAVHHKSIVSPMDLFFWNSFLNALNQFLILWYSNPILLAKTNHLYYCLYSFWIMTFVFSLYLHASIPPGTVVPRSTNLLRDQKMAFSTNSAMERIRFVLRDTTVYWHSVYSLYTDMPLYSG